MRTWLIVVSRDHAARGVHGGFSGFIMANHGKKAPLARMSVGDRVVVYSPRTTYPKGDPLKAVTFVGRVTGEAPEPSMVIPDGWMRRATLRPVDPPVTLDEIREHVPLSRLRFGCIELEPAAGVAIVAAAGGVELA